jgi:uncharacterized protein (TIGR02301 family)
VENRKLALFRPSTAINPFLRIDKWDKNMRTFQALTRTPRERAYIGRERASLAKVIRRGAFVLPLLLPSAGVALAQPKVDPVPAVAPPPIAEATAPYDEQLLRLAEVLGSVHYLRNLCNPGKEDAWRNDMQRLLETETKDEAKRKEKLTAAFNRGYRSFASVYTDCTQQAVVAEERYRAEGATLATEITARYGN